MNRSLHHKFIILVLTFVLAFCLTTPAAAEGLVAGDNIPAGIVYDHDAILIGENVSIDGTIQGNAFVLGNQVTVNGKVEGSLILLGQNASIGGAVTGEVYGVLLTLDLAPNATIERDLYAAVVSLTSGKASLIGRDLYAIGLDSGLSGQVGRDLHTVIGPIQLYNGLVTLLGYENLTLKLHFDAPQPSASPSGSLLSAGRHAYERTGSGHLANLRRNAAAPGAGFDWGKWGLTLLRNWMVLLLFGLLVFWLGRKALQRSGEALQYHPWRSLGTGMIVLVMCIASIAGAMLLAAMVFAIGLGFIAVGLWPITIALWAVGYAALAVALVTLWTFIVYGTKIVAFYFIGSWVFGKLFSRKNTWMDLLALLAGSVVFALLRSAPYVGWLIDILVTALGAGAAWLAYRGVVKVTRPAVEPVLIQEPVRELEPLQPVEPVQTIQPVEAESAIVPATPIAPSLLVEPRPVRKTTAKKAAPQVEPPAMKVTRRKPKPASPVS